MTRTLPGARNRPGFAMFMALGALVALGVLVTGSSYVALQESQLGNTALVEARAFTVAEYGLNMIQAEWDKTPNIAMYPGESYPPVGESPAEYVLAGQGVARVRYVRLNPETFWIVSEGRASVGNSGVASRTAVKRVGAILRLRTPSIQANAAITSAGSVTQAGNGKINGNNLLPQGWQGCSPGMPGKAGVTAAPGATVTIARTENVVGTPQVERDEVAGNSNTYVEFGDETWNTLVAQANHTITSGQISNVAPTVVDGACNKASVTNWGEPRRVGHKIHPDLGGSTYNSSQVVVECQRYFPIIYSTGDLKITGARGQGILLVNGDLETQSGFDFVGLIIVKGSLKKLNGSVTIIGAVMAAHGIADGDEETPSGTDDLSGSVFIQYSQCGVEHAVRGTAQVVQARERSWAELY